MRKLDDFKTERDRFIELIEYAENLDNYLECRYDRTIVDIEICTI